MLRSAEATGLGLCCLGEVWVPQRKIGWCGLGRVRRLGSDSAWTWSEELKGVVGWRPSPGLGRAV